MKTVLKSIRSMCIGLLLGFSFEQALATGANNEASGCVEPQELSREFQRTQSGLEFRALRGSPTDSPGAQRNSGRFTVHASGCLLDGTKFWSTSEPIAVSMDDVIPGWREGLALMSVGDVFVFRIPPHLAYGVEGYAPSIPPQATLIFRIELINVSVDKPNQPKAENGTVE